jgi:hypothetical protein
MEAKLFLKLGPTENLVRSGMEDDAPKMPLLEIIEA